MESEEVPNAVRRLELTEKQVERLRCFYDEQHSRLIAIICHRFGLPRHRVEDIVQEVFAKALVCWDRVERADSPKAYVTRMAVNLAVDYLNASKKEREMVLRAWQDRSLEPSEDVCDDPELIAAVDAAISELPAKQRRILELMWQQGASAQEVAVQLQLAPATVRVQRSRALPRLRAAVAEHGKDGE